MHSLRNSMHVLMNQIDQLGGKLDRNAGLSRDNAHSLEDLIAFSADLKSTASKIEEMLGDVVREKPLLMRDLHRVDTNATELTLATILLCESVVFSAGSEILLRSALFASISAISDKPILWGFICGVLGFSALAAFFNRSRRYRTFVMALNTVYFGVTGFLTMALQPGVLGWVYHVVACLLAFWVFVRGPSRAT